MKAFTAKELAAAVQGELIAGSPDTVITSVGTDSRTTRAGMLFIPLIGERFDGHDYMENALSEGAAGCLCSRLPDSLPDGGFLVRVSDTLLALKDLALWYRNQFDIPFVQITGSVGKTTTKEMIAGVLSQRFDTLSTWANYNNEVGTPLTLLQLESGHRAAVIETGMDGFGQIRYLGEMVKPEIAVITNIGDMHIEFLGSRENILKAKYEIFDNLAPDGMVVLNGDDELLNTVSLPQRILRVGRSEHCDIRVSGLLDRGIDGIACTVQSSRARYTLSIPSPGKHMIYPAAMAVAVGEALGLSSDEISRGIASYEPAGARMRIIRLSENRQLLDDCYNAGPQSMRAALETLAAARGRRIAVLGDMAELGELTVEAHREIGRLAKRLGVDKVIAIGAKARDIADAAGECASWYAAVDEAMDVIRRMFAADATMLVKASHSMHFERITKELTE